MPPAGQAFVPPDPPPAAFCKLWHYFHPKRTIPFKVKLKLKLNSVALVRERTISTERPPLVCEVSATDPYGLIVGFLDRSHYFLLQVAPQLYSRG
jgi:hypothetical protein